MELLQGIMTRRSVRNFSDKPVLESDILDVVKAGMQAPSAHNQQSWEFVIVTNKTDLTYLSDNLKYASMAKHAAFGVVVCGNVENAPTPEYWQQDCAAAMENMLLACHSKGIGAVWLGMHPNKENEQIVRQKFNIPENIFVHSVFVAGYPGKDLPIVDRFVETKIHKNVW